MHQNLSGQLLHELGRQIVGGELPPGYTLPKVEVLSDLKGVSRTVIREALKGLEARNLVASQPKTGTAVRPRSEWQWWNLDVLQWAVDAEYNHDFLRQLTEMRFVLEPAMVAISARNASADDLELMKAKFSLLEQSVGDAAAWADADYEFHSSLLRASHNELMVSLVQTFQEALLYSREKTIDVIRRQSMMSEDAATMEALRMHRAVLDAVCERDGNLAFVKMQELLLSVAGLIAESAEDEGNR